MTIPEEGIGLFPSEDEAFAFVQKHIDELRWWILPFGSPDGLRLAEYVERTYYAGDYNKQFKAVYMTADTGASTPLSGVFLAHKEFMTMDDFRSFMTIPDEVLGGDPVEGEADPRDVFWTPDAPIEFRKWFYRTFKFPMPPTPSTE